MSAGEENIILTTNQSTNYTERNVIPTQVYHEGKKTASAARTFKRRIGSTTYLVRVQFSKTSRETMDEKIMRMIRNESESGKAAGI